MNNSEKILSLFTELRQQGFYLTMEDYWDVLKVVAEPDQVIKEISDRSILQICSHVWVKSPEQKQIFNDAVNKINIKRTTTQPINRSRSDEERNQVSDEDDSQSEAQPSDLSTELRRYRLTKPTKPLRSIARPEHRYRRFQVNKSYHPASLDQMSKIWSLFNNNRFSNKSSDKINVAATLKDLERNGIHFNLVNLFQTYPHLELLFLIDRYGSMIPFHYLSKEMIEAANSTLDSNRIKIFYFLNWPTDRLYQDPECFKEKNLNTVLHQCTPKSTKIVIFSDAGAARRNPYNEERYNNTQIFLSNLEKKRYSVVWINPVPRHLWPGTTAAKISSKISMFVCDRKGLEQAAKQLLSQ